MIRLPSHPASIALELADQIPIAEMAPRRRTTPSSLAAPFTDPHIPAWYSEPLIHQGYRPITYSVQFCFQSLAYLHNETVNVFSHLLPAFVALILIALVPWYFHRVFPSAVRAWQDKLRYRDLWVSFDYAAILFQILGSFVSGIYIGFYCEPHLQKLYWSMIGALSLVSGFVRPLRVCSFMATGFSTFAPILHAVAIFPYRQLDSQAGLRYYYAEGVLILIGTFHYISHFPESWRPGKFDIWGSSHQIFHIFVVLSAAVHLYGITSAYKWNYENPRCLDGSRDIFR
ncbi:hypothetical protein QBC34DRAFT_487663 [Podospora aff. communis PSN243]|uniref:Uncharacterized protein n=1 Tax=Podospora aff. communis PSN243 TaxID=3040156 RepID=A0AAV9G9G2_9PEZI|nr:hypothetical protein QBC34DRAFT_487663 [Podospora aff. communis PSN243]